MPWFDNKQLQLSIEQHEALEALQEFGFQLTERPWATEQTDFQAATGRWIGTHALLRALFRATSPAAYRDEILALLEGQAGWTTNDPTWQDKPIAWQTMLRRWEAELAEMTPFHAPQAAPESR